MRRLGALVGFLFLIGAVLPAPGGLGVQRAEALATMNVKLSVTSGKVGTPVTATGTYFKPRTTITVWVRTYQVGTAVTDSTGKAVVSFLFPSVVGGRNLVTFRGVNQAYSAFFTVIPGLWPKPRSAPAGTIVKIGYRGFQAAEKVTFTWSDGKVIGTRTASLNGDGSISFTVPAKTPGGYRINAKGSIISSAYTTLQITA
jgi:hypothetical protein